MAEIKFSTGNNNNMNIDTKKASKGVLVVVILIAALVLIFNCFTIVEEGYRGVKYQLGRITHDDLTAGLRFKIPFIEEIRQVEVRDLIFPYEGDAYTRDTQIVNELRVKLTYRYETGKLSDLIRGVGIDNVADRYLRPNVQKVTKDEIGKVAAEMLVQNRSEVQTKIQDVLTALLAPEGIIVTAFAIENISFDTAFEASIQQKVIAEQDAFRMQNVTKEREEQARQVVIAAEADGKSVEIAAEAQARAIELIQKQLTASPQYIEYLKIQNWNGILPQVIGDGVNPFVVLGANDGIMGSGNTSGYTPTVNQD